MRSLMHVTSALALIIAVTGPVAAQTLSTHLPRVALGGNFIGFIDGGDANNTVQIGPQLLSEPGFPTNTPIRLAAGFAAPVGGGRYGMPRAAALPGTPGRVQSSAGPLAQLKPGRTVWVTTIDGRETKGTLISTSADGLEMALPDGTIQPINLVTVRKIEGPDSIRNGTVIGMLIGAASGAVPAAIFSASYGEGPIPWLAPGFGALGAGIGALCGALGDSMKQGRQTIYMSAETPVVTAGPIVSSRGVGVGVRIRW